MENDEKLNQAYFRFKAIESHIKETIEQLEFFEEQANNLRDASKALDEIPTMNIGTEMYVQLAHGIRVKANLAANDHVMVHVGADTTVHKKPLEAKTLINEQLQAIQKFSERLTDKLQKLSTMADEVNEEITQLKG